MRIFNKSTCYTLLLMGLLFSSNVFSAKQNIFKGQDSELNKMKSNMKSQKGIISNTANEISRLEKNLNIGNKRYLRTLKKRRLIEITLFELQKNSHNLAAKLDSKLKKIKKNLRGILINTLGEQDTPSELLARKLMIKNLLNEKKSYEEQVLLNKNFSEKVKTLSLRINEYKVVENELTNVLRNLEYKKRDKTDFYLTKVKQKDLLQSKLERVKIKFAKVDKQVVKAGKIFGLKFKTPIDNFIGLEYKKKGVTFKYKGRMAFKAAAPGKIVYKGILSNFGNVIMIDHGKETRTILLGKFNSKLEKGAVVKSGQVLGFTRGASQKEEKLYFEVRKKNKVQNTFQLIDRNSLANNQQSNDNT